MPNNIDYLPIYFGITSIGAVMVPMNTRYRTHEVSYILKNSDARAIFMVPRFLKMDYVNMLNSVGGLEKLEYAVVVDEKVDMNIKSMSFSEFLSYGKGDISDAIFIIRERRYFRCRQQSQ